MTRRRVKRINAQKQNFVPIIEKVNKIKALKPLTKNQAIFMTAIDENDLIVCDSISGTGKTTIATGMAAQYLEDGIIDKIIVMRPPIQCGRDIGFLPGTEQKKIEPYLRPIFDALDGFLTPQKRKTYQGENKIQTEIIGYSRGMNYHNSFVIVDEMQNTTYQELKMIGTRMGKNSKLILIGDMSQSDLGTRNTQEIHSRFFDKIKGEPGIEFVKLTAIDIVRSRLAKIIATKCD